MRMMKSIVMMAVAMAATVGYAGLSEQFGLDMMGGMRITCETERITYSPTWGEGAPADATAVVSVDGTTLVTAAEEGSVAWTPATNGTYTLTHTVMSRGSQYGERLTATFKVTGPKVMDVVAKQRYPWNGLVDITCRVTGINGKTNGLKFAVAALMPNSGDVHKVKQFWVVKNGVNSTDRKVQSNGSYKLLWDAQADLGAVIYSNMVMRVTVVDLHGKVQLWEGGPYWATTNIGAEEPEDYGYYFWWGDTIGYKRENNRWVASDGSSTNFNFSASHGSGQTYRKESRTLRSEGWITEGNNLMPSHDAAHVQWGGGWRMPRKQELDDLESKCDWTWTTINGVKGYFVRGKGNGPYASASIFLPCAGYGAGTSLRNAGSYGYYWSSHPDDSILGLGAYYLDFSDYKNDNRDLGFSVRPIQEFTK